MPLSHPLQFGGCALVAVWNRKKHHNARWSRWWYVLFSCFAARGRSDAGTAAWEWAADHGGVLYLSIDMLWAFLYERE